MFRLTQNFCNTISRPRKTKLCQSFCYNSTVIQEGDLELKQSSSQDVQNLSRKESFEKVFLKAKDVPSLLQSATSKLKVDYAFKALDLLATWNESKPINFAEIENDVNYPKLVSVLEKQANHRSTFEIINAIKNLMKLGVPSSNFLIESLENDLLWNVRKVSVHALLQILAFQSQHQESERQKKVLEQTLATLERRWTELTSARDFILLYALSSHFSSGFLAKVDDSLIQASENLILSDLARVIVAISTSKRRPTPVLRTLAFHMFKNTDILSPKQISNVAFAINSLSFPDEALLGKLSSDFLSQIDSIDQPAIIGTLLFVMGQMRWRDKALIDAISEWVIKNVEICRCSDIAALILTMASVSYSPNNIDEVLQVCLPRLNAETIPEKSILVDIAWSLTVLDKCSSEHISSLLDPAFIKDIPLDDPSCVGTSLKLLNINAAASAFLDGYKGPKLQLPSPSNLLITRSRKDITLHNYVQKVLHNFLPPPKYLKENVNTDMGFTVDAELIVDRDCKPLSLTEYSTSFGEIESIKPLPEGSSRIALMIWSFKDYTIGSQALTGQNSLAVRLLNKRGYKVVEVPYFDINKKEKTLRSVQYLEKKIKETVNT